MNSSGRSFHIVSEAILVGFFLVPVSLTAFQYHAPQRMTLVAVLPGAAVVSDVVLASHGRVAPPSAAGHRGPPAAVPGPLRRADRETGRRGRGLGLGANPERGGVRRARRSTETGVRVDRQRGRDQRRRATRQPRLLRTALRRSDVTQVSSVIW